MNENIETVILVAAGAEWRAWTAHFPDSNLEATPYGECFTTAIGEHQVSFLPGWPRLKKQDNRDE